VADEVLRDAVSVETIAPGKQVGERRGDDAENHKVNMRGGVFNTMIASAR
jgi:hypothetical protein